MTISVNPFILFMPENSNQSITVTNNSSSSSSANNVAATIPAGSHISVQANTCGSSLPIGQNCSITFEATTQEGPTIIAIKGDNTNTANVYAAVTAQPLISITGPVQQSRIVSTDGVTTLDLDVTNNADSLFNANNITVSDKTACPNLSVDSSNCTSLAPNSTCQLRLTTTTPYAPCNITVSGSNTGNSPTTLVAFSHLGGLVFEKNGSNGKVVIDAASEFTSEWTYPIKSDVSGATSDTDGIANTNAIITNSSCTNQTNNCAAYRCRAIGADWYLPAKNEMQAVVFSLCPGSVYPCAFGSLATLSSYWSSTQWFVSNTAYTIDVPDGNFSPLDKWNSRNVRCIRNFQ